MSVMGIHEVAFESFGVRISIRTNDFDALESIRATIAEALPRYVRFSDEPELTEHVFNIRRERNGDHSVTKNGELIIGQTDRQRSQLYLASQIRLTVAQYAVGFVFLHSGVVSWRNQAILIPGDSYSGKTTLTTELIKRGAHYYSDEYAILDENGRVHPFPKTLSIRGIIDDFQQVEFAADEFGGIVATKCTDVGLVLLTKYKPGARWNPRPVTAASGVFALLKTTVPIRDSPEFSIRVLKKAAEGSVFLRSARGDAGDTAKAIIEYMERAERQDQN